jgi:CRP-like cAMP-binding protein
MTGPPALQLMLTRLEQRSPLDALDRAAILSLPHTLRSLAIDEFLVWQGDGIENVVLLRDGFICRHKITEGGRQIVSLHLRGDFVTLQAPALKTADFNAQALTPCEIALIPGRAIVALAKDRPAVALALWLDTTIEGAVFREWIANIGRRDARSRIAHILCEFGLRLEQAGLALRKAYDLPLTQEQLGDALGLTPVHVNRTLKGLEVSGLISRERRTLTIPDWEAMCRAGDFDGSYLHLARSS